MVGILMDLVRFMEGIAHVSRIWKDECYESFVWRRNYVCLMHALRERKVTVRMGENETEIDFVLKTKEY